MPETADRRGVILAEAAKLFARKGVSATTVREIGDAAGILSGSLYHHFESKEAIVDEILASWLDDLLGRSRQATEELDDPKACLAELIRISFQAIDEHPDACQIYQNDFNYLADLPRFGYLRKKGLEFQKAWVDVILEGVARGQFREDVDPRVFYRFARDAVWPTVRWYNRGGKYRIEELADECIKVLMDGFGTGGRARQPAARTTKPRAKAASGGRRAR